MAAAGDVTEAEEIESILRDAGIAAQIEPADDFDPEGVGDVPQRVLVADRGAHRAR